MKIHEYQGKEILRQFSVPVPRGYDEADGTKRENGVEVVLPDRARIGLANMVFLDFRVER